ncbi:unnamed protein product [Spirodela intermedia]|uniref:Uncharacterized protein n=1 Tax=Spirodela intermedia TaxID=51605 RepID=A0A7I8J5V4_SPIIN|nr:unnamed protein product [Spirodela intermedia]CAA6665390.1 unnamed protein product [Spirodela intermedia]
MRTLLGLALFLLVMFTKQGVSQTAGSSLKLYVDSLPAIPKIYGYSNESGTPKSTTLTIGMFAKKWKFHRDLPSTTVFVFGTSADTATFPGPVIEALQGVPLYVKWENHLPQAHILPNAGVPAVVHLHGGVNEPQSDGSAFAWFTPGYREKGEAWSKKVYTYPNVQHPGNLLYHDHALGLTRINLLAGLLGAYVIRNPKVEHPFGLPSGDLYDRHLILADRSFNADGSIYMNKTGNNPSIHPQWQPEYFGDAIVVNGKAWPYLKVRRRKYRFRITNVSNARHFLLALSNGLPFIVVGSDSSYLSAPVRTATILLAPAEGFDVVIDFSKATAGEAELTNSAPYPRVMKFIIAAGNATDESRIPTNLASYSAAKTSDASVKRYITLYEYMSATDGPTHLYINGKRFTDPVTEKPKAGSTEVWEVINLTADHHPLHIHLAVFQAIKAREIVDLETFKNCMTQFKDAVKCNISSHATGKILNIPAHEKTWKNVVKIEPGHMTTIVVKFRLVDTDEPYPFDATAQPGYVYHCHILDHEDNEMIRPMNLVK